MTSRITALVVALVCIGLVVAQDVVPLTDFFHTWQYATALALGAFVLLAYVNAARKGEDGALGKRMIWAMAGALVAIGTGIASGLLGPDTQTISHAPGTVAPIPDLRAAAFFTPADAGTIAAGSAHVVLRRPGHLDVDLGPNERKFIADSVLMLEPVHAAFVEARDAAGNHLTITQPTNPSFLSPVLLFPNETTIEGKELPLDTFATPALQRTVRAMYLPPSMTAHLALGPENEGKPAILYAVDNDSGKSLGIAAVPEDSEAKLAGLRLRATLGSYPKLVIASAPAPLALLLGCALFVAGVIWALAGLAKSRSGS